MSRNLRLIALALIFVLGTTTAVQAFPLSPRPGAAEERGDRFGALLGWLATLFTPSGPGVTPIWEQAGSSMDPNGRPTLDEGSQMDPNGQPILDEGSSMDPNGAN